MAQIGNAYKVVFSTVFEKFVDECNEVMKEGYQPVGGIFKPNSKEFMQAFTNGKKIGRPVVKKAGTDEV